MPSTISGYEDPKYQQYDYVIAAETFIFNYKKNEMGEVPEYGKWYSNERCKR
ncbi:MAG: hypothetical protein IPG89_17815 [Bacteroidetes bacterium]|nr:hypothetical protein [Bacteroidota bacterium]